MGYVWWKGFRTASKPTGWATTVAMVYSVVRVVVQWDFPLGP